MKYWLTKSVSSFCLSELLYLPHMGDEQSITAVAPVHEFEDGVVTYAASSVFLPEKKGLVIAKGVGALTSSFLMSDNPRLDFIKLLDWFKKEGFLLSDRCGSIDSSTTIHKTSVIEPGAVIGAGCNIGAHCHIHNHAVLGAGVIVGSGVIIGHDGFGYERDENGVPLHFPHLGKVVIEDDVVIGNHCSVARGVLNNTKISSGVRVDDDVYIAHNVVIEANALVMSGARLNGRVIVKSGSWIGTGALIREGCCIGVNAVVGMGSVVTKDVASSETVVGNPAKKLNRK